MVLVQCTSHKCDLSLYEVWIIGFNTLEVMARTRFRTAQSGGVTSVYTPPISFVGVRFHRIITWSTLFKNLAKFWSSRNMALVLQGHLHRHGNEKILKNFSLQKLFNFEILLVWPLSACIAPHAWFFCNGREVSNLNLRNIPVKFGKNPVNGFWEVFQRKSLPTHIPGCLCMNRRKEISIH